MEKVNTPTLYVCTATGCDFSAGGTGIDEKGQPRLVQVTTRAGNKKLALASPPYGVVSAKVGEKAVCPVCGAVCTTIEDGRHSYLRLNSQRITALCEKMRLIGNTMKGAQYEPTIDDVVQVQKILYAEFDRVNDLADKRIEKIKNPDAHSGARKSGQAKIRIPMSL